MLQLCPDWNFFHKEIFSTQVRTTQYPDLFVTYREGFNFNCGNKNQSVVDVQPPFSQNSISSPLVFESLKN